MKTDPRRFAPLGLVLALLALLSFIGILIIKGLSAAAVFTLPDPKMLDQAMWVSLAVVVLGLALTAFLDPEGARKFFVGRQAQYGSNSVIMLLAFLGILFFVNLMAYQYNKDNPPFDITEDQQNSLAPETLNILHSLTEPITIRAYYSPQNSKDSAQKLLENFERNSNGKFTYKFIDPELDPLSVQNDGVTVDGSVVMRMGNLKEVITFASEQTLDSAIVRLLNPEQLIIYFLTGHGERDTERPGDTTLSQLRGTLENKNYAVKVLNLGGDQQIPADAKVVVIAGPQKPLAASEVAILEAYLEKGGALIAMEDPRPFTQYGDDPDPLGDMLAKWGITLEEDVIIDPNFTNPLFTLADPQNYGNHPITDRMRGFNFAFYTTRSIKLASPPPDENTALTPLTQSKPNAWGETGEAKAGTTTSFDPATDKQGPLVLAIAAENFTTKARVVVFGDSDFATDANYLQGFGDILVNAVDWGAEQENLITLTPKNNVERTFQPPSAPILVAIILLSICVIPLLVVGAGVASWYSRRRRG